MAKAPGDSRIPTGARAPLPGAAARPRRTLGFPASRLLLSAATRLPLPGPKPEVTDRGKSDGDPDENRMIIKRPIEDERNGFSKRIPSFVRQEDNRDCTFSLCNKIADSEAEKTYDIIGNTKDSTFDQNNDDERTFSSKSEKDTEKEKTKDNGEVISKMSKHFGERVRAVMSEGTVTGILKYVGHVQTDGDLWCGLETDLPSADYHSGSVNGVKYFSCKKSHGILIPLRHIKLESQPTYCINPKMEMIFKSPNVITNLTFSSDSQQKTNVIDITHRLVDDVPGDNLDDSGPFSLLVGLDSAPALTTSKSQTEANHSKILLDNEKMNNRLSLSTTFSNHNEHINNDLICDDTDRSDGDARLIDAESMIDLVSINFDSSDEFIQAGRLPDSNVPLLDKASMVDNQTTDFSSISSEGNRRSLIISKPKICDISVFSKFESPSVGDVYFHASTPLPGFHLEKVNKEHKNNESLVLYSTEEKEPKQFRLGPLTRKQNVVGSRSDQINREENKSCSVEETDTHVKASSGTIHELPSPTVSDNSAPQISKQNSFDESLGILTPDLMDSISFLDNVRSPSTDDFNELLDNTKTIEKNSSNSETPSTENIKSLTPDALKLIQEFNENMDCTSSNHCMENTILNIVDEETNRLLFDFNRENITDYCGSNEDNDAFIRRPFQQNLAESLLNVETGSTTITQNIDDELLPSVHSSILDPISSAVDTTVNLDLSLDSRRYDSVHPQAAARMDQTPSPEELPLDPIDLRTDLSVLSSNQFCSSTFQEQSQADSETKTDTTKSATSKASNSFITSITSITSLDGYQGDGEMSRPVSRGADQSPTIGHRGVNNLQNHWQNIPINRRPDPMTDSDFFTESDADGHEEQVHRGDRRAQVIDGALYGGGKASSPPVMVSRNGNSNNEDSCMESSGVFTDMETHRCSPLLLNAIDDLSPEGSSPSTRSELSQKNSPALFYDGFNCSLNDTVVAVCLLSNQSGDVGSVGPGPEMGNCNSSERVPQKRDESSTSLTAPTDKMNKEEKNMALKRHKMPRRDVVSKVKTMLTKPNDEENQEKRPSPKGAKKGGRWDAVMNKISAGKSDAKPMSYLKDVKSKVTSRAEQARKNLEDASNTSPKTRTTPSKLKSRRVRSRLPEAAPHAGGSARSSPHSSQSDVSLGAPPPKHVLTKHPPNRNAKKRDVRTQSPPVGPPACAPAQPPPHQVTSRHLPPTKQPNGTTVKKGGPASPPAGPRAPAPRKPAPRRAVTALAPRQAPASPAVKDPPRPASPKPPLAAPATPLIAVSAPPPVPPAPPNKCVEALAVLVQYLVFQLDALNAPRWRAQAAGARAQLPEAAARLQRALSAQTADHRALTEYRGKISKLESELSSKEAKYNASILALTSEAEGKYRAALEESAALSDEIKSLKGILEQLRKEVADSRATVARCEREGKLREQHRAKLEEELQRVKLEAQQLRQPQPPGSKEAVLSAEVESLKSVLDLKMTELGEERRRGEQLRQAEADLPAALQRAQAAQTLADYLRVQLQRKLSDEATLVQQNKQLHESFVQMAAQKNRLSLHNEELQYKLKHNTEVATLLAQSSLNGSVSSTGDAEYERLITSSRNHTFPETFVRGSTRTTASFNEKYLRSTSCSERQDYCGEWLSPRRSTRSDSSDDKSDISDKNRTIHCFPLDDNSPPNSPKIKGVVEKNDSVSWIVEIEEAPEETVSRIVRRANSFRSSVSPHPVREALKRQRPRPKGSPLSPSHLLSQSASASSLESSSQGGAHCKLFRSNSIENKQYAAPFYSSTPNKHKGRRSTERMCASEIFPDTRPRASSLSHEIHKPSIVADRRERSSSLNKEGDVDLEKVILLTDGYDCESLVTNADLALLQDCEVPKESAGEALVSGANSEDDSSLDERSHSPSDSESVSESDKYLEMNGAGERLADPVLQKIAETMGHSLSTTPMEVSWSEDGECLISETDI